MLFKSSTKDLKIGSRNKWRKVVHWVSTNISTKACYWDLMWNSIDSSTTAQSIENYDFSISKSKIQPKLVYLFKVSFFTTLDIYKSYFKSHHTRIRELRDLFFCVKLLHLYSIGFCNQVLLDHHCWWSEELCSQKHLLKLLELITYWDPWKGLVTNWRFDKKNIYWLILTKL